MKTYAIVVIALLLVGGGAYAYSQMDAAETENGAAVVCTMDAKLCSDGSYVGRTGPNCEFAQCPAGNATSTGTTSGSNGSIINASGTIDFEGNIQ